MEKKTKKNNRIFCYFFFNGKGMNGGGVWCDSFGWHLKYGPVLEWMWCFVVVDHGTTLPTSAPNPLCCCRGLKVL